MTGREVTTIPESSIIAETNAGAEGNKKHPAILEWLGEFLSKICSIKNNMLLSGKLFKIFLFFRGETMELLKTMMSPFKRFASFFTEEIPHDKKETNETPHELTAYGRQLYWEKRRKEELLREQQNK